MLRWIGIGFTIRSNLKILLFCFLIALSIIIITTPVHEAAHWVMSEIDPYVDPVEFHVFDQFTNENNQHILSSALGCVVIKEKYEGAFADRPFWADILQEIICVTIQIIIALFATLKILKILTKNKQPILSM